MIPLWAQSGGANGMGASFASGLQNTLVPTGSGGSSTPTSTRATTAYQTDFEAKQNAVLSGEARFQGARRVENHLRTQAAINTNTFAGFTQSNGAITTGVSDPDGGTNAVTYTSGAASGQLYVNIAGAQTVGDSIVESVWVRRRTGTGAFALNDYSTNEYVTVAITSSWQRISVTGVAITTGGGWSVRLTTSGDAVDLYHPQYEITTGRANQNPSEYVSVGVLSAPYQGAGVDGVQYFNTLNGNTVAGNVVTEAACAPIVAGQAGVSASAPVDALGPYGEIDELSRTQYLGVTGTPATQTTASLGTGTYCLWITGTGSATSSAGTATITGAGAATAGSPNVFTVTVAGTVTVTVAGSPTIFQLENGSWPSSYIANTGAAGTSVTRVPDVDQYVSSGNISATMSGTMQVTPTQTFGTFTGYLFSTYVDANNSTSVLFDGTNLIARKRIGGVNHDATIAWTPTANTMAKVGWRFDGVNGSDIWLNGTKGVNDSTTTAAQIGTNFQVGADGNGANQDFCMHRSMNVYPASLSNAAMASKTT